MLFEISLDGIKTSYEKKARTIRDKGKSIVSLPKNFTLIDIETTGLDPKFDDIIEIGAIKVVNNQPVDSMSTLILPDSYEMEYELPIFIENLTGITTNELRTNGSSTKSGILQLLDFVGNDTIIGYNVSFDINFIYDTELNILNQKLKNNYIDIMRFSRKLLPDMKHHRVRDMLEIFNIESPQQHRALNDCKQELEIYNILKDKISNPDDFIKSFKPQSRSHSTKLNANTIHTSETIFDDSNPFFSQYVAFTGGLDTMLRKDAMQLIKDIGGEPQNSVTQKTNYLLLGNNFYASQLKDGMSTKYKHALQLKENGQPIEIITENVFFDMLNESNIGENIEINNV